MYTSLLCFYSFGQDYDCPDALPRLHYWYPPQEKTGLRSDGETLYWGWHSEEMHWPERPDPFFWGLYPGGDESLPF